MISGNTKICGLIGYPVKQTLSPAIHNSAFQYLDLDYVYVAFEVKKEHLSNAILAIRSMGLHGLNITMPHKTNVVQFLDELNGAAKYTGSVNTILNKEGVLFGYTTDGIGASRALEYSGVELLGKKVVVLGAGGASRSVSFIFAQKARELVVLNRTVGKAEKLVKFLNMLEKKRLKVRANSLNDRCIEKELKDTDIIVNATSVGMFPQDKAVPINPVFLHSEIAVLDLVYEPLDTMLLMEARKRGAKTVDGLTMLVFQGAIAFEIWTKERAPIEIMMKAARKDLAKRSRQNSSRGCC